MATLGQVNKRDSFFTTVAADPSVAFLSENTDAISLIGLDQFTYDNTSGEDVFVYVLDPQGFDLTLPVSRDHIFIFWGLLGT